MLGSLEDGFHMSQDDFCKLKPADIPEDRKDDEALSPTELTLFRSISGGWTWWQMSAFFKVR